MVVSNISYFYMCQEPSDTYSKDVKNCSKVLQPKETKGGGRESWSLCLFQVGGVDG